IGKSNLRLSLDLNFKEATLQVVYDVLKLTPFYKAFPITADALEIYMQEFWATAIVHHHSIRFKMNNKKHIVNLEYFREMLQICPKLPNQQFEELPFEEAILTFLRDLGHSGEIKMITDVNVNKLHQPWRSFAAGMYHKKNVDYAYLLWEDFVYQVENKNVKKSNEMYYPRFTKVIVNFFMTKDQSIPRQNSVNWHYARDDHMFTTIKVVSRHEDTQLYGAILPNELTNEDIRNSESYKEYYAIASGAEPPKTKASVKKKQVGSDKTKTPPTTKGKRLKTSAKAAKPAKKKQPAKTSKAKGLTVLSEVALTEAEQMKLATKRSLIETHSSHASGSGADEGTGSIPGVPDVPTYGSDDEQISWKSSDEEDDDEVALNDDDDDNDDDDNNDDDFSHYLDKESSAAGTDNRPPMLVESDYESWKIRIERYIRGKTLVQVTRDKRDEEFTEIENNKELADIQATNILSQGLPRHVFNILNQTRTGKEIWDNLINDMKITQLDIPTHQMNTKFVNNLPPYWAKYVTNVKNNKDISATTYVELYTYLKSYEPHAMKTLKKQEQSTSIVDPLAYLAQTTHYHAPTQTTTPPPPQYGPLTSSTSQQVPQSSNDAMLATMNQIVNLLSGFQKQFPPTNNQLRTSSNSRSHATVHDGQIITETVQRRAPGNVGNTGNQGTQNNGQMMDNCKEKKRVKDSQYFKDKMLLMEAKEKGTVLDAEAEAFLADVECTAPYDQPLAITTTNMFEAERSDVPNLRYPLPPLEISILPS
ncbi:hypothetical protein Tco_0514920, partial [Tanacetum coccineum]